MGFDLSSWERKLKVATNKHPVKEEVLSEREEAEREADAHFAKTLMCVWCNTPLMVADGTLRHLAGMRNRGGCTDPYVIGCGLDDPKNPKEFLP